ncbi:MAG: histidine kinase [Bacteroidia bacterium]|nr:histidine kinase [Bacteroidia bacterium]
MAKKGWAWYLTLGIFYLGLGALIFSFYSRSVHIRTFHADEEIEAVFEGNDWVTWKDTPQGVIAFHVHPLPLYKPIDKDRLREGDRLLSIDYNTIPQAEVVDKITGAARPGYIFIAKVERTDPTNLSVETREPLIRNGFRLTFSFNQFAAYWHIISWVVGIGAFVSLVMLVILLPIIRGSIRDYLPLLGIVITALLFFMLQLLHHVYLIVESDLVSTGFEKVFIITYCLLLFLYGSYYFYFKSESRNTLFAIPSFLTAGYLLYSFYDIIFVSEDLKYFHDVIENYTALFFLIHVLTGVVLYLQTNWKTRALRRLTGLVALGIIAGAGIGYYFLPNPSSVINKEHIFFLQNILLFFPLINATFLQLQFGKVSLVVTQTLQYMVAFLVSVILYLLVIQLFDYTQPNIQYRRLLEFVTFVILVVVLRLLYVSNENRLSRYFVSSQQEKLSRFKSFIARIPQYTSSRILRKDLVEQLTEFFNAEVVHLWWKGDTPDSAAEQAHHEKQESIYGQLTRQLTVWSKTKEISPFRLTNDLEKYVLNSPYTLISPITVDKDEYALLLLGKKKRGVYNLSDLELISQLIQQTQLTLNVLQLINREKELIQQTYEANLTALRSQINPHFLFNTLNSITYLVHESPDLAEEAIEKLAFIFRYTLRMSSQNFVSLSSEMNLISTYLDLEKIRFGERLDIHIEIDPAVKDIQLPAFILSTLVENCVKHGISKIMGKGLISIEAYREEGFMICEVIDNGPGIDLSRIHKSTGLSNSIARLENIYDIKNLLYFENTGNGTLVRLKIPVVDLPQLN